MKLKKKNLTLFYQFLAEGRSDAEKDYISLADARIRDRFASKQLFDALRDFEEARKKIYEQFAIKDKDGNIDFLNGNFQFAPKDVGPVMSEVGILEEEEVDLSPENPAKLVIFLNNSKREPKIGDTVVLDEIIMSLIGKPAEENAK